MSLKKYLIILISSLVLLGTVITLYFVLPHQIDDEVVKRSDEYLHYAQYFNFELSADESYYSITGLKDRHQKDNVIMIPNTIDNIPVKKLIGDQQNFFSWRHIKQIDIPASIEYIGTDENDEGILHGGTYGNNIFIEPSSELTAINVSNDNKVYSSVDGVLYNKDQTYLLRYPNMKNADNENLRFTVPDNVKYIYAHCFYYNSTINRITLGENVEEIMEEAFYSCSKLRNIEVNNNLKVIGQLAFKESTLLSIKLPEGFLKVGVRSFGGCNELEYVYLPSSIDMVGLNAFSNCRKITIYTPSSNVDRLKEMDSLKGINVLPED